MSSATTPSFHLLTSTRHDTALLDVPWNTEVNHGTPSPFFLLPYHLDRLMDAAKKHVWAESLKSLTLIELTRVCTDAVSAAVTAHGDKPMRLRVLLSHEGALTATASPALPLDPEHLLLPPPEVPVSAIRTIYIDTLTTEPSIFTSTKSTYRVLYNDARARVGLSPLPTPSDAHIDVLIHSPDGFVLETSIRNLAFKRGDAWVTPLRRSGCLPGVMRRLLLEKGSVVEGEIKLEDVVPGELVLTFNGVEAFWFGRIAPYPH